MKRKSQTVILKHLNTSHVLIYLEAYFDSNCTGIDLNTSHVLIYPTGEIETKTISLNLNTSHVLIYH